jgi:two-component system, NtrC family, sensor kinase
MRCPRCQHENRPQATFCEKCGTSLTANPSGRPAPSHAEITSALSEALEQQAATGEILRVISSSPTDTQPVFDAIVRSAARLCDGLFGSAFRFDGERLHRIAHHNLSPAAAEALEAMGPLPLDRESAAGKAVLERAVVHVPDIEQVAAELRGTRERARLIGMRAVLVVPMLREGRPVGIIVVGRRDPVPFTARQIELLETFANQAVIAIENVRLFQELETRNRDLTEALEQ